MQRSLFFLQQSQRRFFLSKIPTTAAPFLAYSASILKSNNFHTTTHLDGTRMADDIKKHGIVPDVVDDFTPSVPLQVSFGAGTKLQNIGDHLTPTQVKSMPQVTWDANPNDLYTLMMTDPDAPSRKNPIKREWIHWVVVNIPGNDLSKGQHAIEYVGAGPPQGSGPHRYVLLLFKQQQGKIDLPSSMRQSAHQAKHRANFNTRKFAEAHHLGKPVGCAMFQAEYDDWVPHLYKTLTD